MDKFEVQWKRTAVSDNGFPYEIFEMYRENYPRDHLKDATVLLRAYSTKPYKYTGTYPDGYEMSAEVPNVHPSSQFEFRVLATKLQKIMLSRAISELGLANVSDRRIVERMGEFIR